MAKQLVYQSRFQDNVTVGFISKCKIMLHGRLFPGVVFHKNNETLVMLETDFHARYVSVDTDADRD